MERQRANGSTITLTREQVFAEFHARTGLQRFAPDFLSSLWRVMRDRNSSLAERTWAWVRWRCWCNSSECPVSDWNPAYARKLGQLDCAVDLAWLAEGKSLEWVEKASVGIRAAKSQAINWKALKSGYSRAFAKNQRRGLLDIRGHGIYAIPVPPSEPPPQKLAFRATFDSDPEFLAAWKVGDPCNFQVWQDAKKALAQAKKVARNAYQEWLKQATPAPTFLDVNTPKNEEVSTKLEAHTHTEASFACVPSDLHVDGSSEPEPDASPSPVPVPKPPTSARPVTAIEPVYDAALSFAAFWKVYSGHPQASDVGQEKCRDWWALHIRSAEAAEEVYAGLKRWWDSDRWSRGIGVPNALRFLSEGWYRLHPPGYSPPKSKSDIEQEEFVKFLKRRVAANGGRWS